MRSAPFDRFGGNCAILLGIGGLVYAILFAFVVAGSPSWVTGLWLTFLLVGGLLTTVVTVALYQRLRETDEGVALWALLLGFSAAVGGLVHAAYQLIPIANPSSGAVLATTPADPLGILRFGIAGVTLLILAVLIVRSEQFPRNLGYLAYFGGALLMFIYVGRLFDFITPVTKITLIPPFLYGFIVHPVFYVWLGRELLRTATPGPTATGRTGS
ncbi:MAG TPA: hypothetical protein VFH75_07685 [Actinomycetota bacterium]|nr:hypothetical protein [Actinomycetota bacterium]